MRRRLALVFVALAVMLAIGFLVPLGRSVQSQARLRALAGAQADARGVATALAAVAGSTGELPGVAEVEFVLHSFDSSDLLVLMADGSLIGSGPDDAVAVASTATGSVVAEVADAATAAASSGPLPMREPSAISTRRPDDSKEWSTNSTSATPGSSPVEPATAARAVATPRASDCAPASARRRAWDCTERPSGTRNPMASITARATKTRARRRRIQAPGSTRRTPAPITVCR